MSSITEAYYALDTHGIAICRGGLSQPNVSFLQNKLADLDKNEVKFEILKRDPAFRQLMEHPWVLSNAKAMLGHGLRLDHAFGLQFPPSPPNIHGGPLQHAGYVFNTKHGLFCGRLSVGFFLNDQSPETGGFTYVPGSHKSSMPIFGGAIHQQLLASNYDNPLYVVPDLKAGDIVMFHDCLVHGTAPCKKPNHQRISLYYMYSPEYMAWRKHDPSLEQLGMNDTQRQLLRAPYIAEFDTEGADKYTSRYRSPVP